MSDRSLLCIYLHDASVFGISQDMIMLVARCTYVLKPCVGHRVCKNSPGAFPGQILYRATKSCFSFCVSFVCSTFIIYCCVYGFVVLGLGSLLPS